MSMPMNRQKAIKAIVAREAEIAQIQSFVSSKNAEFVAVYGRRRVGKTFLIREFFRNSSKIFYFECTGQKDAPLSIQIDNFCHQLELCFNLKVKMQRPKSWNETIRVLHELLKDRSENKFVLFLDELPWLAGPRTNFVRSLEYFWNLHWSNDSRFKLIVCGSATSWMHDHLIEARGGLHNRLTRQMHIKPFTFDEVIEFTRVQNIRLQPQEILKLYMIFDGIPYYWSLIPKGKSAAEIVEELYFKESGKLHLEFANLFRSLFVEHDIHEKLVRILAQSREGLSRGELLHSAKLKSGGSANRFIRNLELSGFIMSTTPFGKKSKDTSYRLIDQFCLFHLYLENRRSNLGFLWRNEQGTPGQHGWLGYAFENCCLRHVSVILQKLKINDLVTQICGWRYQPPKKNSTSGVQIDLLFVRRDGPIHIVECKYSSKTYSLDKGTAKNIAHKVETFRNQTRFRGQVFVNLIVANGYRAGIWDEDVLDAVIARPFYDES